MMLAPTGFVMEMKKDEKNYIHEFSSALCLLINCNKLNNTLQSSMALNSSDSDAFSGNDSCLIVNINWAFNKQYLSSE